MIKQLLLFSDVFEVNKEAIKEYGAVNINLINDTPLFIDPLLIYGNKDNIIKQQYENIVKYLEYLNKKAEETLDDKQINYYFSFKEIKQNWLGVSKNGNEGNALGNSFANDLYTNIHFVCDKHDISEKIHIEKMYLFKDGVGKDRISDWATNVLLSYFVEYTETFARSHINPKYCKTFFVKRCIFDYENEVFVEKEAYLPFITKPNGKEEYVLLTPRSILRKHELAINHKDMMIGLEGIKDCLPDDDLKFQVNRIIGKSLSDLYKSKEEKEDPVYQTDINKAKEQGMVNAVSAYPSLYDYYVKDKENSVQETTEKAQQEVDELLSNTVSNDILNRDVLDYSGSKEFDSPFDEALYRVMYLKQEIEVNGVWKNLYYDDKPIYDESDLQNLFKMVWCRSKYLFSPESNAGVGPTDFLIALGSVNKCIIEFKLASNSKLASVYNQVEKYKVSQRASKTIIVIFYFSKDELAKATKVFNANPNQKDIKVILIDCTKDNKKSASK